jgi:hypothetical protein
MTLNKDMCGEVDTQAQCYDRPEDKIENEEVHIVLLGGWLCIYYSRLIIGLHEFETSPRRCVYTQHRNDGASLYRR